VCREADSCCPSLLVVHLVPGAYRIGRVALINRLKPSGNYMYRQFNIQKLFPYTALTDWFFISETVCVYCAERTAATCIIRVLLVFEISKQLLYTFS
jgi:hypothetical protein